MKKYTAPAIEFDELLADSRIANNDDIDLLDDDEINCANCFI